MTNKRAAFSFEEILKQNERRIRYHIHRLNIQDPHQDFFQEGLCALWNAYEKYEPDKGPMATYFNYTIRNRLIDRIRKEVRIDKNNHRVVQEKQRELNNGNHVRRTELMYPILNHVNLPIDDYKLWDKLKNELTANQWKWVDYYIINDLSIKEIAKIEGVTEEAVKSWGKQVRKKLRNEDFRKKLGWDVNKS